MHPLSIIDRCSCTRRTRTNQGPDVTFISLITHTKQLLIVTFSATTAGIGASFQTHGRTHACTEGQTDVEVKIVILIGEHDKPVLNIL